MLREECIAYLLDIVVRAAVDVAGGAVLAQGTGQDVAEGDEATVALARADDGLLGGADVAGLVLLVATVAAGEGEGSGGKGKDSGDVLHFEGWWWGLENPKKLVLKSGGWELS